MDRKADIRREVRARRKAHVANYDSTLYLALQCRPLFDTLTADGPTLAAYIAHGSEADPSALITMARGNGCPIALPHLSAMADAPMRFLRHDVGDALDIGPHGIRQPPSSAAELTPDIILMPLVAFDRRGTRLGQGGGHYDRTLPLYPAAQRIGIAFALQEVDDLPSDPWDIPLHAIITEREWITP